MRDREACITFLEQLYLTLSTKLKLVIWLTNSLLLVSADACFDFWCIIFNGQRSMNYILRTSVFIKGVWLTGWAPTPVWWVDTYFMVKWMLDLFYLPNETHFSFISNYIFLKKKCIMLTTGASTLTYLHQNKILVKKILCMDSSPRVFKKRRNEMHAGSRV